MNLFGKKGDNKALLQSQRRQARDVDQKAADETRERGARARLRDAQRSGKGSLFSSNGAAGVPSVREKLG